MCVVTDSPYGSVACPGSSCFDVEVIPTEAESAPVELMPRDRSRGGWWTDASWESHVDRSRDFVGEAVTGQGAGETDCRLLRPKRDLYEVGVGVDGGRAEHAAPDLLDCSLLAQSSQQPIG